MKCVNQLTVYADNINILGQSVHPTKKSTDTLVVVSKEIGLGVNVDESKNMVMSRDQNAGRNHNIKFDSKSLKRWNSLNI